MPSPVGHVLGGLLIGYSAAPSNSSARPTELRFLAVCVVAACLPDIDFLWGAHNRETHSVGFALIVGLAALLAFRSSRLAIAAALAAGTHVLFDWLGSDDFPPLGVMALWPFSRDFYFADAYVFATISRRYWLQGFVTHNVMAVVREIAILGPPAALVFWWRRRRTMATPSIPMR